MVINLLNFNSLKVSLPWNRQKPTVLIVEDNRNDADLMRHAAEAEGLGVVVEQTAEGALGVLHKNGKDYIGVFVDVGLPYMTGWKFTQEVNKHWPSLTVCIMSSSPENLAPIQQGRMYDVLWKSESFYEVFRQLKMWKGLK